jgi:hypothetical protein
MFQKSKPGEDEIFCDHPNRHSSPHSLLYNGYRVSFPGVNLQGCDIKHPPPSSTEVKERAQLQLRSPYELSWPVPEQLLLLQK